MVSTEIAGSPEIGLISRGEDVEITTYLGAAVTSELSANVIDLCPVGALTSTDFRFKMRVWFLKQTNSIDTETSVGANTVVWSREGQIYRLTPRRNDDVNDTWMPDSGRELFKAVMAADRLAATTHLDALVAQAAELFKVNASAGAIAVVGSGRSSVEEQFLTKKLAAALALALFAVGAIGGGGSSVSYNGHNGLLILSKHPMTNTDHLHHQEMEIIQEGQEKEIDRPHLIGIKIDLDDQAMKTALRQEI